MKNYPAFNNCDIRCFLFPSEYTNCRDDPRKSMKLSIQVAILSSGSNSYITSKNWGNDERPMFSIHFHNKGERFKVPSEDWVEEIAKIKSNGAVSM